MVLSSSVPREGLPHIITRHLSNGKSSHRRSPSATKQNETVVDAYKTMYPSTQTGRKVAFQESHDGHSRPSRRYTLQGAPDYGYATPESTSAASSPYGHSPVEPRPINIPTQHNRSRQSIASVESLHGGMTPGMYQSDTAIYTPHHYYDRGHHHHHAPPAITRRSSMSRASHRSPRISPNFPTVPVPGTTMVSHGAGLQEATERTKHHLSRHSTGAPLSIKEQDTQQLQKWFRSVDKDKDGLLTPEDLHSILLNGDWTKFNMETIRLLVSLFDLDGRGRLNFAEFRSMWRYVIDWRECFDKFDEDQSGTIRSHQFKRALRSFGYDLDDGLVELTTHRFNKNYGGTSSAICIDNFIQACVTIKGLRDAFQAMQPDVSGRVTVTYSQLFRLVMNDHTCYHGRR
ncbi:hypothetical protein H4R34_000561 [Dimargaris verticillata]|uniref:EF-hand domain-containing protein n=1 Tax=Dimargaris verticillata TaxID=2761393 RepID=A0A9W8BCE2_9FUNG|nr:hypothetical protein H4R34_000561 [Dimargaris verticillata]